MLVCVKEPNKNCVLPAMASQGKIRYISKQDAPRVHTDSIVVLLGLQSGLITAA